MQDNFAIAIIFLAILGGAIARAVYPFLQHQKANEDTLRTLSLIPPDKLTPDQKIFLEEVSKPINFHRFYMYTAILGFAATASISISSFTVLIAQLPVNITLNTAMAFIPVALFTGWGGGSMSNQLLSSKSPITDNVTTKVTTTMASKIEAIAKVATPAPKKKTTEFDDSV